MVNYISIIKHHCQFYLTLFNYNKRIKALLQVFILWSLNIDQLGHNESLTKKSERKTFWKALKACKAFEKLENK